MVSVMDYKGAVREMSLRENSMHSKTMIMGICILIFFTIGVVSSAIGSEDPWKLPRKVEKYQGQDHFEKISREKMEIFTTDDIETVTNFYSKSLNMDPFKEGKFLVGTDAAFEDKTAHSDELLWLKITTARKALKDKDLFGFLQAEMHVKNMHTEQELQEVREKYAHLAKAWYPDVDGEKKLKSCSEATRENVTAAKKKEPRRNKDREKEMMAQMQKLMAQGKFQEASKLAQESARPGMETSKAMQQENKTDHWDDWIACLDDLDKHDFQTKIEIDLYERHFKSSTEADRESYAH